MKIEVIRRTGRVLTPSALHCLAQTPTVNITVGCAHRCVYCYTRGYSRHPGDGRLLVWANTAEMLRRELARRRTRPAAVYFCPSSDPFQPLEPVLQQTHDSMRILLRAGIAVQFATKGRIRHRFVSLFADHADLVHAQIGLTTLDQRLTAILEPGAAPIDERLASIESLSRIGVAVRLRADPLIHGVTDGDDDWSRLLRACRKRGVRSAAAGYLFLRPAISNSLRKRIGDPDLRRQILQPYERGESIRLRGAGTSVTALPAHVRRAAFSRLCRVAQSCGIKMTVCGCKNADLTNDCCHLTPLTTNGARSAREEQFRLWSA